eukprot:38150-Pyramimonas_sp.AAC.1
MTPRAAQAMRTLLASERSKRVAASRANLHSHDVDCAASHISGVASLLARSLEGRCIERGCSEACWGESAVFVN